ncbi:hypothetical protein F4805DRAFT_478770 [Annulohypoxylon moriforme]|nr:hypothetical protein F4805DRAFT_478770 [Annulohypoxylon moriforme]
MCNFWEILTFNCGHEQAAPSATRCNFCLFRNPAICTRELGRFRILETHVNNWCPSCAQAVRLLAGTPDFQLPSVQPNELEHQRMVRKKIENTQFMPQRVPLQNRLAQLNGIAGRSLQDHVKKPNSYAAPLVAWVVRYIESLPPWMDRPALMSQLRPWFADLLDEGHQICLRPVLQAMQCEEYLDDVMVWTYTP